MNILVLASEVPATAGMPGSPRLFSICRGLSARHRLSMLAFGAGDGRYQALRGDPSSVDVFENVELMPSSPQPRWWGRQSHRLRQAPSFITQWRTPDYFSAQRRRIREVIEAGGFDVVYVDGLPASQYLADAELPCPVVIDIHDCSTLLQLRSMKAESTWLRRLARYPEYWSVARLERSLSRSYARIIVNSSVDECHFKKLDSRANTLTIGNGVDTAYFATHHESPDMTKLVFTGVMDYAPNEDAALHFANSILPSIRSRHANVQFWVVGLNPTKDVRALSAKPGIHVTGGVPDVRPFIATAGIFVCPLRYGAGVKNKLLAALAMRRAVVATSISVEGLDLRNGVDLLVADEPSEFANHVNRLIEDPDGARRMAANGQATVHRKYSWESSAALFESLLEGVTHQDS